jgi:hypothetical protein
MTLIGSRRWLGMSRVVAAALFCGLVSCTSVVSAQPLSDSMAASFKESGDRALDEGDYATAVEAYHKGNRIQHHPTFDFNLARALQGLGRFAEALDSLEHFAREAPSELLGKVPGLDDMLDQLRDNVGELILDGPPRVARVAGNGRDLGDFQPGKRIRCNRGPLDLSIVSEGYVPISRRVSIVERRSTKLKIDWVPVDDRALVTIASSIPAARVSINGRMLGQTPLETRLSAGSHRLRLEHPDSPSLETDIVLRARESRQLTLEMPRHAPLWAKWWFWTAAAGVAAGLVVGGVALSTSKSPTPGDIQPGIVSAPLVVP